MRRILKIAKAELFTLFYSPVAWLILVAFTVQVGLKFTGLMADFVYREPWGSGMDFDGEFVGGMFGLYNTVQQYLYLYMPFTDHGVDEPRV